MSIKKYEDSRVAEKIWQVWCARASYGPLSNCKFQRKRKHDGWKESHNSKKHLLKTIPSSYHME